MGPSSLTVGACKGDVGVQLLAETAGAIAGCGAFGERQGSDGREAHAHADQQHGEEQE